MAVTTYSGLSTAVFRRLNRPADSAVFDDCLSLVEAEINRRLALKPLRLMQSTVSLTIDSATESTPSDYLDTETLHIGSDPVLATSLQNLTEMFEQSDVAGQPRYYAQEGSSLRFYPSPDTAYTATHTYWAKVPGLTSGSPTNWLSLAHPDVYFHGTLAHAMQEYFDEQGAATQAQLFDVALEKVLSSYPHRPDRAPLKSDAALRWPTRFNIVTG